MENNKKKNNVFSNIHKLFDDKKKRALLVILCVLPFLVVIGILGYNAYKEVKGILELTKAPDIVEIKDEFKVETTGFILRDNATDYQKQLFSELKEAIEGATIASDEEIAALTCKNFVADFYTWSNKQGQYDVGGMYYVYDGEYEDSSHFRENVYQNARYNFYKYLSTYIKEYGAENLLEVDNVEVAKCQKAPDFVLSEHVANKQDENGDWYDYREDRTYEAYEVTCNWTYKTNAKFDSSKYTNSENFLLIKTNGLYIVAANEGPIDTTRKPIEKVEAE